MIEFKDLQAYCEGEITRLDVVLRQPGCPEPVYDLASGQIHALNAVLRHFCLLEDAA